MSGTSRFDLFANEAAWPFALHLSQLSACEAFLTTRDGPRILQVFGPSGSGKSFLVRELMVRLADGDDSSVGLYVDFPAGEIEATEALEHAAALLSAPRTSTRDRPSFVGRKVVKAWLSSQRDGPSKRVAYGYGAGRELTGQIPVAGPFVKAFLPTSIPSRAFVDVSTALLRFLVKRSRSHPVLLVLDNVQFVPYGVRELIERELAEAGQRLRLVLIERTDERPRINWIPAVVTQNEELGLDAVALEDVERLVQLVLPTAIDASDLAKTITRRSDGNLKSVWYQLRLIAARREHQRVFASSYEDVIGSLAPFDKAVLRLIVFTVGGLTVPSLAALLHAIGLGTELGAVSSSIEDLIALGLVAVDGPEFAHIRVEHEVVSKVVSESTPEEEKLEFREQVLRALGEVLDDDLPDAERAVLCDRLLGVVTGDELRRTPSQMAHVVDFISQQYDCDRYRYLAGLCRDSVCWDVLVQLPSVTVRHLLDAIQKESLFSFGLIATTRLQTTQAHAKIAALYEAKYLVQLFRYDEAKQALSRSPDSAEKRVVAFNIALNLVEDSDAAYTALEAFHRAEDGLATEDDFVILRNAVHLFEPGDAMKSVNASMDGFARLGRRFGLATTFNNRGIVHLAAGRQSLAQEDFEEARRRLVELDSAEVYQPLVNLGAVAALRGALDEAQHYVSKSRTEAPRSLAQDDAMLNYNDTVLDLAAETCTIEEGLQRALAVVEAAQRTQDQRFIDVTLALSVLLGSATPTALQAAERISAYRSSGRVSLEAYVRARVAGREVELPYVLSPNWRY